MKLELAVILTLTMPGLSMADGFTDQAANVQEGLRDSMSSVKAAHAAAAGWADAFKNPAPSREYTAADADQNPESQSIVRKGNTLYFIDRGLVFQKNLSSGRTALLSDSMDRSDANKAAAILLYKGELIGLSKGGGIYIHDCEGGVWIEIGAKATHILAVGEDLFAVSRSQLWVHKGLAGARITFIQAMPQMGQVAMALEGEGILSFSNTRMAAKSIAPVTGPDGRRAFRIFK